MMIVSMMFFHIKRFPATGAISVFLLIFSHTAVCIVVFSFDVVRAILFDVACANNLVSGVSIIIWLVPGDLAALHVMISRVPVGASTSQRRWTG